MILGFRTPFPMRVPAPVGPGGEVYSVRSVSLKRHTIYITLAEWDADSHLWYHRERELEWEWYPGLTSVEEIVALQSQWWRLTRRQREELASVARVSSAGRGTLVGCDAEDLRGITGKAQISMPASEWLLSESGESGAVLICSSLYHHFDSQSFEVGAAGSWESYPELTRDPSRVIPVGRWVLWIDTANVTWRRVASALRRILCFTTEECAAVRPTLPGVIGTGLRGELLEVADAFLRSDIRAEIRWTDDVKTELDWYDLDWD